MADNDNIIKIKFLSDGDKGLVKAIEKLDIVHKKLTQAQENLIDVGKKGGRANVKAINTLRKYNELLKKNNLTLKDLNLSARTYSRAVRGNQLDLEKVRIATMKHTQSMKIQQKGMFDTEHSTRILGGSFAVLRSKLLLASFAGTLVASTVGRLARQFGVQEDAERDLSNQLGHVNNSLLEQASALQNITTHGDESLLQIMRFASTLGIQEKNLVKTTKASIGLSEAYGIDLRQSTRMLALATSGNTEMLNRYIPELRNAKTETEKLAIISQKATEGFQLHIDKTGTLNFALDQMGNSVGDVAEKIGGELAPLVILVANGLQKFADSLDSARVTRFAVVIERLAVGFLVYRANAIRATIATIGFSKALTKSGFGAIATGVGLLAFGIMELANAFEVADEDSDEFNDKLKATNKLTKEQIEQITALQKLVQNRVKSIDDEISSLLLKEAQLKGVNALELLEIEHGFEFVEMNKKKIQALIDMRARVKELEDKQKQTDIDEKNRIKDGQERDKETQKQKEQHQKFLEKQKKTHIENMKRLDAERLEAKKTVFADDLGFQMLQIELEAQRYRQLLQSAEDRNAIDEWESNTKKERAIANLEEESALFNAGLSSYDAFVQGIMDKDMNMLDTREAVLNAFKESAIKFIAEMIKEKIKQAIADAVIRKSAEQTAIASAKQTSAQILTAYAPSAVATSTATFGASAVAGQVAMGASYASLMGLAKFESGGLIGGQPHSQGGTLIEAEKGEFIMSKNAVDSIGLDNLSEMNSTGQSSVTVNIKGNVIGTRGFVRDYLIPEITRSVKKGLA